MNMDNHIVETQKTSETAMKTLNLISLMKKQMTLNYRKQMTLNYRNKTRRLLPIRIISIQPVVEDKLDRRLDSRIMCVNNLRCAVGSE